MRPVNHVTMLGMVMTWRWRIWNPSSEIINFSPGTSTAPWPWQDSVDHLWKVERQFLDLQQASNNSWSIREKQRLSTNSGNLSQFIKLQVAWPDLTQPSFMEHLMSSGLIRLNWGADRAGGSFVVLGSKEVKVLGSRDTLYVQKINCCKSQY